MDLFKRKSHPTLCGAHNAKRERGSDNNNCKNMLISFLWQKPHILYAQGREREKKYRRRREKIPFVCIVCDEGWKSSPPSGNKTIFESAGENMGKKGG